MKITGITASSFKNTFTDRKIEQRKSQNSFNLQPLSKDTVSFGANIADYCKNYKVISPKNAKEQEEIFEQLRIKYERDPKTGRFILSHYTNPNCIKSVNDIPENPVYIDEEALLRNVAGIEGDAFFKSSRIKNLSTLEYIGGDADFSHAHINKLRKLNSIAGKANFYKANIGNLYSLTNINKTANFSYAVIPSLDSLIYIGGHAIFKHAKIDSAPSLQFVEGIVDLRASSLYKKLKYKDLSSKEHIRYLFVNSLV